MKINETQRIGMYKGYNQAAEFRGKSQASESKKDRVQISDEAKELLGAQGKSETERSEKIESLKKAVSTGTYKVDSGKLAEKMLPYLL